MGSKRKGTDVSTPLTVSIVNNEEVSPLEKTTQMLKDMRVQTNDSVMNSLQACFDFQISLESEQENLMACSNQIKNELENRIQHAREACREESDDLYRMKVALKKLQAEKFALHQELNEMDASEKEKRERIRQYEIESELEIEAIDQVEAERKDQVPRLKNLISLYAMITGIKWDYDREDLLAGQVVRILA